MSAHSAQAMNNRRVHPESAVVLKVAPQALRRSASNGEEGSAAHDGVQEEGFIAGTCAALGQSLCKPKDAAFEVKLARWELFEAVDVDESNLIGINKLSAFLKSFVEQLSQESGRSELELRALGDYEVAVLWSCEVSHDRVMHSRRRLRRHHVVVRHPRENWSRVRGGRGG